MRRMLTNSALPLFLLHAIDELIKQFVSTPSPSNRVKAGQILINERQESETIFLDSTLIANNTLGCCYSSNCTQVSNAQ